MGNKHAGSSFESFLDEQGELEEVDAVAIKRVVSWELSQAMQRIQITKKKMTMRLHTSRTQLDRLLDPNNTQVQLDTLVRAARAAGLRLAVTVEPMRDDGAAAA